MPRTPFLCVCADVPYASYCTLFNKYDDTSTGSTQDIKVWHNMGRTLLAVVAVAEAFVVSAGITPQPAGPWGGPERPKGGGYFQRRVPLVRPAATKFWVLAGWLPACGWRSTGWSLLLLLQC